MPALRFYQIVEEAFRVCFGWGWRRKRSAPMRQWLRRLRLLLWRGQAPPLKDIETLVRSNVSTFLTF
jgi:hypothetical protein